MILAISVWHFHPPTKCSAKSNMCKMCQAIFYGSIHLKTSVLLAHGGSSSEVSCLLSTADAAAKLNGLNQNMSKQASGNCTAKTFANE